MSRAGIPMISDIRAGRLVGLLLFLVFALGVFTFQFLQVPVLSGPEHVMEVATHTARIVASAILGVLSGSVSIWVAAILLPVFRKSSETLAIAYLAFTVVNFVAIAIDTVNVVSVLELSRVVSGNGDVSTGLEDGMVALVYGRQWWTHHLYLLISCLPVAVFYSGLYVSRVVPRLLALFGIFAAILMAVEMVSVMLGSGISVLLFIPIALVQVATPLWLLAKGFRVRPL